MQVHLYKQVHASDLPADIFEVESCVEGLSVRRQGPMPDRERERETDNYVLYHPFISIVSVLGCLHRNSDWSMGDIPGITMPRTSYGRGFLYERSLDIGVKDRLHFWTSDMPLPEEPFTYPDQDLCWILMILGGWRDETLDDRDQQWLKNIRCKYVNAVTRSS